ncbi:MAG: cadherin-like beta sandwich domain-containing protein [Tannerella sp.]|jgi:hypothetical protein|nr:cadherin-like beta sandwich domain-containing protein [Tannerella sp.]
MKKKDISQTRAVEATVSRNDENPTPASAGTLHRPIRRPSAWLRTIRLIILFALAALCYQAAQAQIFSISPTTATVAKGGTQQFTARNRTMPTGGSSSDVTANVTWTASVDASWLTVAPASGSNNGTVTVTATANTSSSQRTATVSITGSSLTRTVSVTQAAGSTQQPSGNNALRSLLIEGVVLSPAFSPSITNYTASIPNAVTSLNVIAQAEDGGATVNISNADNLRVGDNTIRIIVTAANGSTRTYTVVVTRETATAVEAVAMLPRVWTFGSSLYISVPQPTTLQVYTLTGILTVDRPVPEGQTAVRLSQGIYIVRLGNRMTTKVMVK